MTLQYEHKTIDDVQQVLCDAEHHCTQKGVRLTEKRKLVLSCLLESKKALSAYDLVDFCREKHGESLPVMSVYRMLTFLEEENLVHKLNLANKFVACSHISCDHDHQAPQFLICGACNRVQEVTLGPDTENELRANIKKAGFHLQSPQLEINCLCGDCVNDEA